MSARLCFMNTAVSSVALDLPKHHATVFLAHCLAQTIVLNNYFITKNYFRLPTCIICYPILPDLQAKCPENNL